MAARRVDVLVGRQADPADSVQARLIGGWLAQRGLTGEGGRRAPALRVQFGRGGRGATVAALTGAVGDLPRASWWAVADAELAETLTARGIDRTHIRIVSFPIPDALYEWSDAGPVFSVTRRFHLEARPRVVAAGDWRRGQGLTRLLPVARWVRELGGEVVLLDAGGLTGQLAPVVARLGLQTTLVLMPTLAEDDLAGLLHGADAFWQLDVHEGYPHRLRWAAAAGVPCLSPDDPTCRRATRSAFLAVNRDEEAVWRSALEHLLTNGTTRERLLDQARAAFAGDRLSLVGQAWAGWLAELAGTADRY
jgi:hypothetical protein